MMKTKEEYALEALKRGVSSDGHDPNSIEIKKQDSQNICHLMAYKNGNFLGKASFVTQK